MNSYGNKDNDEDEHGYDNLCKYSIEKCELCEMVFSSRFANIIHTSQHIIIPLIKQKIYQCKKCLYCFTTKSDLTAHKQAKHNEKDINNDDNQVGHVDSQNGQEGSENGQEESQNGQEEIQIGQKESQLDDERTHISPKRSEIVIEHKKSGTGKKKSRKRSQSDHKEIPKTYNEIEKVHNECESEKDALLRSIIMKQPIVKVDNIANIFAKTLLATKNDEKNSKLQKDAKVLGNEGPKSQKDKRNKQTENAKTQEDTKLLEKDSLKTQKDKKNKKTDDSKPLKDKKIDEIECSRTKTVSKEKPPEIIFSSNHTSQIHITEIPTKILIGGKKPMKRKSPDKTDNTMSKRDKITPSTDTNKSERDRQSKATVTNGVHTTDLTENSTNRHRLDYRAISPDVISIDSDDSNRNSPDRVLPAAKQSTRSLFVFTYGDDKPKTVSQEDQSKTTSQKEILKSVSQKDTSKTVPQKDSFKTKAQKDSLKTVSQEEILKTILQKDPSENIQQNDWYKNIQQKDQSKNASQKKQSFNIPLVITESDNELDASIDELLNNITSPIKKSNFRSKLQFEDDENLKLLDLDRELSNLCYEFKSVHYDELVEPVLSECQRCHMIFMNKLTLYKHETSHIRFRRYKKYYFCKHCESYYPGNHFTQKKHYEIVHNTEVDKRRVFSCPVCKLQYYKLKTHYQKYHPNLICKICSTCFGSEKVFDQHSCSKTLELQIDSNRDSKITHKQFDLLSVCELCSSFTKNTANFKYEVVGEKCEVGSRQKCFYCSKEFFEVKLVKRVNCMAATKSQNSKNNELKVEGKKKGHVSNKDKLQIIQKRLKAMKK